MQVVLHRFRLWIINQSGLALTFPPLATARWRFPRFLLYSSFWISISLFNLFWSNTAFQLFWLCKKKKERKITRLIQCFLQNLSARLNKNVTTLIILSKSPTKLHSVKQISDATWKLMSSELNLISGLFKILSWPWLPPWLSKYRKEQRKIE